MRGWVIWEPIIPSAWWKNLLLSRTDKQDYHVQSCVVCQAQNRKQDMAPLEGADISSFLFEKVSIDVSGLYGKAPKGNIYIVSFVDWLTSWPEAYAVLNKKYQTVADRITSEIFPRYGAPVHLVTDKGPEDVNKVMTEALASLNIVYITTTP